MEGMHIVKVMRDVILVEDSSGKCKKFRHVSPKIKKPVAKPKPKAQKKRVRATVSVADRMAAEMRPCKVMTENLSQRKIAEIVSKTEREVHKIEGKIRSMPCKD